MDDYKAAELPLIYQHLQNVENMVNFMKTIWIFDQGYIAMELYARIIEMNSYFIVRLRKDSYKEERKNMMKEYSPISLNITVNRLKKFHDLELKNIYSKKWTMNLRIVTITTNNCEKYSLLTNIPQKVLGTKELVKFTNYDGESKQITIQ